ncbi:hypothetical protein K435DRAFT_969174 [Dendrothele bispora CBS 962.96]|uniref:Uncharacterized protein n=1 Tax=Dendrothele bispora (strain CBS 962.96) TaxID=1314807 RepID=A0A4S8LKB7_DENBC|nr:hypothetical protein K435DRAFT_969174 [Dendrothele bispora CBS 962.96]
MDPVVKIISADGELVFFSHLRQVSNDNGLFVLIKHLFCCVKHAKSSYLKSPPAPSSYPTLTSDAHSPAPISPLPCLNLINFDFLLDIVPRDIGGMRKREIGESGCRRRRRRRRRSWTFWVQRRCWWWW